MAGTLDHWTKSENHRLFQVTFHKGLELWTIGPKLLKIAIWQNMLITASGSGIPMILLAIDLPESKSWSPGLSYEVSFVSVLLMAISEYWKRQEKISCHFDKKVIISWQLIPITKVSITQTFKTTIKSNLICTFLSVRAKFEKQNILPLDTL